MYISKKKLFTFVLRQIYLQHQGYITLVKFTKDAICAISNNHALIKTGRG